LSTHYRLEGGSLQLKPHPCNLTAMGPWTQPRYADNFRRTRIRMFGVTTPRRQRSVKKFFINIKIIFRFA
jgi:hypothetical protein